MLNEDVRARKDLGLMTVLPAYEVGRRFMLAEHLEDLAVTLLLALMVSPDYEAITWACVQRRIVSRSHHVLSVYGDQSSRRSTVNATVRITDSSTPCARGMSRGMKGVDNSLLVTFADSGWPLGGIQRAKPQTRL